MMLRKTLTAAALAALTTPATALAQESGTLAGVMDRVTGQLSGGIALITTIAAVIGFGLVAFGLFKLIMRKPGSQDSVGGSVGMMIGGALLMVVGTVATIGQESVVEGSSSESQELMSNYFDEE